MKVYFVGAGPGDPDLITLKGVKALQAADIIIYAGSLVNREILNHGRPEARVYDSAGMTLEEVLAVIQQAAAEDKNVARVHTGDPSLYGAVREQMDALDRLGIDYEVIPGVSSFLAAAAALKREYTLPEASQTVILTRIAGRTPVPETEQLSQLARHRASMCLFLSVQQMDRVVEQLKQGYPGNTPAAVVQKASWPEEKIVAGTLDDIASQVREAGIQKTALILVGDFLAGESKRSRLYHPGFSHGYRRGPEQGRE